MKLFTDEQLKAVAAALEEKAKDICPICASTQMSVIPGIAMIPVYGPVGPAGEPRPFIFPSPEVVLPNIAVLCVNCGFTELFNVHVLGVAEILNLPKGGEPLNPKGGSTIG